VEALRARYRTAEEIRAGGAMGNLGDGVEITTHGIATRLIAWPGTGFQTEAVHVLTIAPGEESDRYRYDLAEEALLCHSGTGEVWLREQWVKLRPGDLAYVPEGLERAVRNPAANRDPVIMVSQLTPPQFDLYQDAGLYSEAFSVMNERAVAKAAINSRSVVLPAPALAFSDDQPGVRSWRLEREDVRRRGALFNVFMGAPFTGIGVPMRLILWPGAGSRTAGFNLAAPDSGTADALHTHPVSDECLVMWHGDSAEFFIGGTWLPATANDVALAPCGVAHGHRSQGVTLFGGYASPPQLDLLMPTDYYSDGAFTAPTATQLSVGDQSSDPARG
jgi:mannose-6-phosphate isomerase-like protein (cupin superfamily)